jgi:hypothetical protein
LMYVSVGTRPDISFAVNHLAGFLDCYGFDHWRAAIRVLRYLKETRNLCLVLGGVNNISLTGQEENFLTTCSFIRKHRRYLHESPPNSRFPATSRFSWCGLRGCSPSEGV